MKNLPLLVATLLGSLVLVVGIAIGFSMISQSSQAVDQALARGDGRLRKGKEGAPITVVEFSDFQCPACKASTPVVEQVLREFPEDVQVVYRHFPLFSIHPYAQAAAQASEVAAEQGKFWQFHDSVFATQETWAELPSEKEAIDQFATLAAELGIDKAAFMERIQSEDIKQRVANDVADGSKAGVSATPTFYVNGRPVSAPQLIETVREAKETR